MPHRLSAPRRAHILLVDDNVEELKLLLEVLRQAGYQLSVAFNGMEGYRRALARMPQLILMDVRMGGSDGFAACRLLKADPATAGIPVIFVTASNSLEERLTGLSEGAVDYVVKPFEPSEVLARVRIHLKLAGHGPAIATGVTPRPVEALPAHARADQVLVQAATAFLCDRLSRVPSLPEIARHIGTHEKRLTRAFREIKGVSVFEFVREERLRLAQRLLLQTSLPVTDIANETGFSSAANFATAFRARFGVPPTSYRGQSHKPTVP